MFISHVDMNMITKKKKKKKDEEGQMRRLRKRSLPAASAM